MTHNGGDEPGRKTPSPEDIQKDFEEFVSQKYGASVQVIGSMQAPSAPTESVSPSDGATEFDLNFNMLPKDVKNHLDRFVIKQDDAKKALAVAVCDHYNRVRQYHEDPVKVQKNYSKQNVLLLGPTGVGKTYLVKLIAELIGVPFVKADATRFSETGYMGANVDDLIRDLVNQAGGDVALAQYGIVYLDEADKLATHGGVTGRDVSGRGVQFGLLKLLEESDVDLRSGHDLNSQLQAFADFQRKGRLEKSVVNTKHILFIVSGAFHGLQEIIAQRLNRRRIGFDTRADVSLTEDRFFEYATSQDFVEYGFEPEFVGRLPIRVACQHLGKSDLFHILKEVEGSIIEQYDEAFAAYGIDVYFTDAGLQEIAAQAHSEKTGARALMAVCERVLRHFKYELPSTDIDAFVVTKELVQEPDRELRRMLCDPEYNLQLVQYEALKRYERDLGRNMALDFELTDAARRYLVERGMREGKCPRALCDQIITDCEHGFKLIAQNVGAQVFELDKEFVQRPREMLEQRIRQSYEQGKNQSEPDPAGSGQE